jgi:hypothetical protein
MPLDENERKRVEGAVEALQGVLGARETAPDKPERRYDGFLHFYTGVVTFSGALVVGDLAALGACCGQPRAAFTAMLAGLLFWSTIVIITSTLFAGIIQYWKPQPRPELVPSRLNWCRTFLVVTLFCGSFVAAYALRGAAALATNADMLPGWYDTFMAFRPT